ncbi:unnamed protein product [Heligmosomoides polygyrus]|uniref:Secreted protein n=1 Tax=Heligmosomoides polygyrus TaxID=6339 RepID=A0A183GE72_HELPZ|nr:unnamed protein product [Heligmosomoides polygyrus]
MRMDSQQWMACAILSLVIIGCFGNLLSLLLFSRPHMRCSSVSANVADGQPPVLSFTPNPVSILLRM